MLAKDTYFLGTLINNPDAVALSNMSKIVGLTFEAIVKSNNMFFKARGACM